MKQVTIGVLGFQGDIEENVAATKQALEEMKINGKVELVRYAEEMKKVDGLILPGGESTVQSTLLAIQQSLPVLKKRIAEGMPVLGTCAGMIMLSKRVFDHVIGETKQKTVGSLDIVIERNAFGRQNESFEADVKIDMLGRGAFRGVFIRAPAVSEVGEDVEVNGVLPVRKLEERPQQRLDGPAEAFATVDQALAGRLQPCEGRLHVRRHQHR